MTPPLLRSTLGAALWLVPALASAELQVTGVRGDIERNVLAHVSLATEPCDAEAWRIRRLFRSVEQETREALEPFGFYEPAVETTLAFDTDCWNATLTIEPGEPVALREIDILIDGEAAGDAAFADLMQPSTLAQDAPLRHRDYEAVKRAFLVRSADRGYVEAAFTESALDIWPEAHAADIKLHFASGPRYRLGAIQQEQDFIDPDIVSGYLALEPGTPFDSSDLARASRDLSNSGYFATVDVVADIDNAANQEIPVNVSLTPAQRIEYTVGAGLSTDSGPRFRAGYRDNRTNRRGHRIRSDLGVSPVLQGLTAEYRIPLTDPRSDWMSYTAAVSHEETDSFETDTASLGLRRSKRLSASWIRTLALDVSFEEFVVGTERDDSLLVLPSLVYDHKYADRDLYPDRGRRLGIEFRGTSDALGSDTSFLQTLLWARWVRALGSDSRIIARATAGFTSKSDFDELPPSVRFFAGGDETVRGFEFESLGPQDADGNVIGGSNLLVASIEYEHRLRGNFYGAAFVDAGNAFDDVDVEAEVGAGIGLKWRSPVGPLRLYVGFPLTEDDVSPRVHVRLGADL